MSPTDSLSTSHVKVVYNDTSFVMTHGLAGCWCNLSLSCSCYNYVMAVPNTVLGRRLQNTLQHSAQLMESSPFQSQNYSG